MARGDAEYAIQSSHSFLDAPLLREDRRSRVGDAGIAWIGQFTTLQCIECAGDVFPAILCQAEIVPRTRQRGIEAHGLLQCGDDARHVADFGEGESEFVMICGMIGRELECIAQFTNGKLRLAGGAVEQCQIVMKGRGIGIPADGRLHVPRRRRSVMSRKFELCELHLPTGLVGVEGKHVLEVFPSGGGEVQSLTQSPGSGHTHTTHRIIEQWLDAGADGAALQHRFERADGTLAHEWVRVLQLRGDGALHGGLVDPAVEQQCGTGFPVRDFIATEQLDEPIARVSIAAARFGDQCGSRARLAVHFVTPPLLRGFERPICGFIRVALVAGIRHVELLCQQRIRNGETVIVARVALHVHRLRHVAVHALIARAGGLMKTVRLWLDDRRVGESTLRVAAHAELVSWQRRLHAVHVVAVHAAHPGVVHAAAEEAAELVVLIANLAVGIKRIALIGDGEVVVIPEGFAGNEVAGDLAAPRVTTRAVIEMLIARPFRQCGIAFDAAMRLLPVVMRLHRPMTCLTAHGHLGHRRLVAIGRGIVIFSQASVVAGGAHLIPHHAASRPVPPFSGLAVFIAIDVEPVALMGIKACLHRLQASVAAIDEKLPQRIVADNTLHFVGSHLAAESESGEEVVRTLLRGGGRLRAVRERFRRHKSRIINLRIRFALGEAVMRALPFRELIRVALAARGRACVVCEDGFLVWHDKGFRLCQGHSGLWHRQRRVGWLRPERPKDRHHQRDRDSRHERAHFPR